MVLDTVTPSDFRSEIKVLATKEYPNTDEQPAFKNEVKINKQCKTNDYNRYRLLVIRYLKVLHANALLYLSM